MVSCRTSQFSSKSLRFRKVNKLIPPLTVQNLRVSLLACEITKFTRNFTSKPVHNAMTFCLKSANNLLFEWARLCYPDWISERCWEGNASSQHSCWLPGVHQSQRNSEECQWCKRWMKLLPNLTILLLLTVAYIFRLNTRNNVDR